MSIQYIIAGKPAACQGQHPQHTDVCAHGHEQVRVTVGVRGAQGPAHTGRLAPVLLQLFGVRAQALILIHIHPVRDVHVRTVEARLLLVENLCSARCVHQCRSGSGARREQGMGSQAEDGSPSQPRDRGATAQARAQVWDQQQDPLSGCGSLNALTMLLHMPAAHA